MRSQSGSNSQPDKKRHLMIFLLHSTSLPNIAQDRWFLDAGSNNQQDKYCHLIFSLPLDSTSLPSIA
jgi:hypothetical protein